MAETALKGNPVHTVGDLPAQGSLAPDFVLCASDLSDVPADFTGKTTVLNIFPSIDTGVCAASVRRFNELAAGREGTQVLCVSKDLPFALARFCGAEGIDRVTTLSAFRSDFGERYGVTLADGPMRALLARAVVVVDDTGTVAHVELVPDITNEPDYDAAMAAIG